MHDYQRLIDDLRNAMASASPESLDMVRLVAADYSLVCEEANDRLRRCDKLLKQGLRSEALQLCELEPNLLDVVSTLDFPEHEQWLALSQKYRLAPPAELALDVAAELNEAYALQQPLDALLRKHRLLAIARAPIVERLKVLRLLGQLDPGNNVWGDDQRLFETERFKEIRHEANSAAHSGNVALLDSLTKEVRESAWQATPPADLLKNVHSVTGKVRRREALAELERIEVQLNDAFAAFDAEEGRRLRGRWVGCQAICKLPIEDEIVQRAMPALAWLEEQDEQQSQLDSHGENLERLERALEKGHVAVEELERMHHAAVRHGHDLPATVERRYQAKIQGMEFSSRRRMWMIVGACAALVLLLAVGIGAGVWTHLRSQQLANATTALSRFIEDGKLAEGEHYLEGLSSTSPRIAANPQVRELAAKLKAAVVEQQEHKDQFARLLERVRKRGFDDPDLAAIAELRQNAESESEKSDVAEIEAEVARARREMQAKRDSEFLVALKQLLEGQKRLEAEIKQGLYPTVVALQKAVGQLQAEGAALEAKAGSVSKEVSAQLRPVMLRLAAIVEQAQKREAEMQATGQVIKAIGNKPTYEAALQSYIKSYTGASRTDDFSRALVELALLEGMQKWTDFAAELKAASAQGLTPALAKILAEHGAALTKDFGQLPQAEAYKRQLPQLEGLIRRIGDDGPIQQGLSRLFKDRLVGDVWLVVHEDGRWWYTTDAPADPLPADFNLTFLKDFDSTTQNIPLEGRAIKYTRAPQAVVAETVLAELRQLDSPEGQATWDKHFGVILSAIYNAPGMEPVLKLSLLKRVLPVACQGSAGLSRSLSAERDSLEKSTVNVRVKWMIAINKLKPTDENKEYTAAKKRAMDELKDLARLGNPKEYVTATAAIGPRLDTYRWVGALLKDSQGHWTCELSDKATGEGELWVATRTTPDAAVKTFKIGVLVDGKAQLTKPTPPAAMLEGRVVYLRVAADRPN